MSVDRDTLRWAADRLDGMLRRFPLEGRHTRAWWAVAQMRYWAEAMPEELADEPIVDWEKGVDT